MWITMWIMWKTLWIPEVGRFFTRSLHCIADCIRHVKEHLYQRRRMSKMGVVFWAGRQLNVIFKNAKILLYLKNIFYKRRGRLMRQPSLLCRYILFFCGVLCAALGIALITLAGMGTSAVSSLSYVLTFVFPGLSLGVFTFLVNCTMLVVHKHLHLCQRRLDIGKSFFRTCAFVRLWKYRYSSSFHINPEMCCHVRFR